MFGHNVSRLLWDSCEAKSGALGIVMQRESGRAFGGVSFGRPEKSMKETDPEGRLQDERENHHTPHMNILHTTCTELQQDSHPKKSAAMQSVLTTSGQQDLDE